MRARATPILGAATAPSSVGNAAKFQAIRGHIARRAQARSATPDCYTAMP
jgi:hypothetical protein